METRAEGEAVSRAPLARWRRWLRRCVIGLLAALVLPAALYFGAAEIMMRIPVNGDVDPLEGSIEIYLVQGGPHVDVWVPVSNDVVRWDEFLWGEVPLRSNGYVSFGWGDRAFYTQVPEWKDLTAAVAVRGALWPTPTAMRVTSWSGRPISSPRVHLLRVSKEGYGELCSHIRDSFAVDASGRIRPIDFGGYGVGLADRFFEGAGRYHLFSTCNSWTNEAVARAGKRAATRAFFARGVVHQLPHNEGRAR